MNPTNSDDQKKINYSSIDPITGEVTGGTLPITNKPVIDDSGLPNAMSEPTSMPVAPAVQSPLPSSTAFPQPHADSTGFPQPPLTTPVPSDQTAPPSPVKMKKKSNALPVVGGVLALLLVVGVAAFASNTQYFLSIFRGDIRPFASVDPCEVNDCRATGPNTVVVSGNGNSVQVSADGQQAAKEALDNGGDGDTARAAADAQSNDPDNPSRNKKSAPKTQAQKEAAAKKAEETKKKAEENLAKKVAAAEEAKKNAQQAAAAAQFAAQAASQQQQAAAAAASALIKAQQDLKTIQTALKNEPATLSPGDQARLDAALSAVATAQTVAAGAQNSASAAQTELNKANKAADAANAAAAKEEKKVAAAQKVVDRATKASDKAVAVATGTSGTGGSATTGGEKSTIAKTALTNSEGQVVGDGAIASCIGLGGGDAERQCYLNSNGTLSTEYCYGLTAQACIDKANNDPNVNPPQICSGTQDSTGSQVGEFTDCEGKTSTGGCGQVDILDSNNNVIGFVIDKTACTKTTTTTTTTSKKKAPACQAVKIYIQDPTNEKKWKLVSSTATGSAQVVDDTDKQMSFTTGWSAQNKQTGMVNNTEHVTNKKGKSLTYSFSGSSITYIYATDKNYGKADVFIDNVKVDTIDQYSATAAKQVKKVYDKLSPGLHTFKVAVTNTKNTSSKNTYISVDALQVDSVTGIPAKVGQVVRLAVKGVNSKFSQARFIINGAEPVVTKKLVSGEFVYDYTVQSAGTFTILGEVMTK